jgi:tetratricopeptide (TPR) repeat protein
VRARAAVLLFATLVACQKTKGDEMQENLATFKQEQSWDKLFARGQGFAAIGDWTRAEEYFAAALDAGGDSRKIVPQLLVACIRGQKYRVAIQYGSNYLRAHPEDTSTRFIVATLYIAVEEYDQAKENLDVVMQKEPQNAEAHFALGVAFRDGDNDPVRADKEFREYLRLSPKGKHAREASGGLLHELPAPALTTMPAPMAPATSSDGGAP